MNNLQYTAYNRFPVKINVSHDELKTVLLFDACARAEWTKKWQVAAPLEL